MYCLGLYCLRLQRTSHTDWWSHSTHSRDHLRPCSHWRRGGGGGGREMVSKNISVTNWWALGISWTIMQQILDLKINYPLTPWMKTYKYWKEMKILSHSILCSMDCWMAIFFRDPIQMLTNLIHKDELGADWYILGLIAASLHLLYFSLHHKLLPAA